MDLVGPSEVPIPDKPGHVRSGDDGDMAKAKTKDLLLEAGKRSFLSRGYNHSGIDAILQEVGVPKGSFYYYFPSKEHFGLEVLDQFAASIAERQERCLSDRSKPPLDRLRDYCEEVIAAFRSDDCLKGCLVGNLSQEMAAQSEIFRVRLEEIFEGCVERYAACLAEAQCCSQIGPELDPRELAEFWLNSWQGAILRAKSMKSVDPLIIFLKTILNSILRTQPVRGDRFIQFSTPEVPGDQGS